MKNGKKGGGKTAVRKGKRYSPTSDLTVTQAAAELGICEKTLREKYVWTGLLPARKQGRPYRIARADLEAFRAQGKMAWEAERLRTLDDEPGNDKEGK